MATSFQINRSSIREHRFTDHGHRRLDPDEVRLAIDFVAMTSNNVTYAVAGDMLDYWGFFPVEEPWGHVPAMGYGTVIESTNDRIEVGSRHFGFFPMANEHIVRAKATDGGFVDIGEHRATHAPAYRQFADVAKDTSYDPDREAHVALLRGLFLTGWLAEDLLFDNDNFGAEATVITSASSKTSIALAWTIAQRGGHAIGLTSAPPATRDDILAILDDAQDVAFSSVGAGRPPELGQALLTREGAANDTSWPSLEWPERDESQDLSHHSTSAVTTAISTGSCTDSSSVLSSMERVNSIIFFEGKPFHYMESDAIHVPLI